MIVFDAATHTYTTEDDGIVSSATQIIVPLPPPGVKVVKHTLFECPCTGEICRTGYCPWNDGGLRYCTVCDGLEGSLPTDCPGRKMTKAEADAVYADDLDFEDGEWMS